MNTTDSGPDRDDDSIEASRWRRHATESAIGLVVALLLLWTAVAAVSDVPFVYQGL